MPYAVSYLLWAALFGVTAYMGFLPTPEKGMQEVVFMVMAGIVFMPPWMVLIRANKEDNTKHKHIVRNLCIASISGTTVLMALNVMSAGWSEQVGNALHAALVIVSNPMICGQNYLLSLMMWGILLMASVSKTNPYHR